MPSHLWISIVAAALTPFVASSSLAAPPTHRLEEGAAEAKAKERGGTSQERADLRRAIKECEREIRARAANTSELATRTLQTATELDDLPLLVAAHGIVGLNEHFDGRFTEAIDQYRIGIQLAGSATGEAAPLEIRLSTALMQRGDNDTALETARAGLDHLADDADPLIRLAGHNTLGVLTQAAGEHELAVDHYFEAVGVATIHELNEYLAPLWLNIGTLKSYQNDHIGALEAFDHALEIHREADLGDRNAHLLACKATALSALGRDDHARAALLEGLEIAEKIDDPRSVGTIRRQLCSLDLRAKRYEEAHVQAAAALHAERSCENPNGLATSLLRVADTLSHLRRDSEAREVTREADRVIQDIDAADIHLDYHATCQRLAERMDLNLVAAEHDALALDIENHINANKDSVALAQRLARREAQAKQLTHAFDNEKKRLARQEAHEKARQFQLRAIAGGGGLVMILLAVALTARNAARRNAQLAAALAKVRTLEGLLPVCATCKKIRDEGGGWQEMESYISKHSEAQFTHGVCPDCVGTWS